MFEKTREVLVCNETQRTFLALRVVVADFDFGPTDRAARQEILEARLAQAASRGNGCEDDYQARASTGVLYLSSMGVVVVGPAVIAVTDFLAHFLR